MRKYVIWSVLLIMFSAGVVLANSSPVVSSVNAWQKSDGSGIVEIVYWLSDSDGDVCTVSIVVSNDGGSTWTVNPTAFSGSSAVGQVTPSAGSKKITWYSKDDLPGAYGTNYRVKVCADDGVTDGPSGLVLVPIPAGTFQMGDNFNEGWSGELPVHTVTLSSFKMSKHEVTNGQYAEFLNDAYDKGEIRVDGGIVYDYHDTAHNEPYFDTHTESSYSQIDYNGNFTVRSKGGRNMVNDPVVEVSWYGSDAFCDYYGYRLPTEAEWEYAARGGLSGRRFPWGYTITHDWANYWSYWSNGAPYYFYDTNPTEGCHPTWNDGIRPRTSPVGRFPANGYGLYDMAGNVWEWCNDWNGSYPSGSQSNPTGPTTGSYRVLRGGGWSSDAGGCRVAGRYRLTPTHRSNAYGFRVCLDF